MPHFLVCAVRPRLCHAPNCAPHARTHAPLGSAVRPASHATTCAVGAVCTPCVAQRTARYVRCTLRRALPRAPSPPQARPASHGEPVGYVHAHTAWYVRCAPACAMRQTTHAPLGTRGAPSPAPCAKPCAKPCAACTHAPFGMCGAPSPAPCQAVRRGHARTVWYVRCASQRARHHVRRYTLRARILLPKYGVGTLRPRRI